MLKATLPSAHDRQPRIDAGDVQSGGLNQRRHVERPKGRDPGQRFEFIQSRASALDDEEIDA